MDKSIKDFYNCIEEAIDKSKGDPEQASYFEDEPTKHEVTMCYKHALADAYVKPDENVNNIETKQPEMAEELTEKVNVSTEEVPKTTKEFVSEAINSNPNVEDLAISLVNVDIK